MVKLKIRTNDKGYKNIDVKEIPSDNSIVVKKRYAEGRPITGKFGTSYSCSVEYEGEDVGFFLKEYQHESFATTGGEGDLVKITAKDATTKPDKDGKTRNYKIFEFEVVTE